jgi:hypothetical protein
MELIIHYALEQILVHLKSGKYDNLVALQESLPENKMPETWINVGGQFIKKSALDKMLSDIRQNRIDNWNDIHQFYLIEGKNYQTDKLHHALDILWQVHGISFKKIKPTEFKDLLFQSVKTAEWITKGIFSSREKDYLNPFRKMVYENQAEMNQVLGKLDDNSFIKNQDMTLREYKSNVQDLIQKWKLN